jgi:TRAP-type C4-dicarboxylate transport system permease small subunit
VSRPDPDVAGLGASPPASDPARPDWPDDSPLARRLRRIDRVIGLGEQGVLFGVLVAVILTATAQAIVSKAFDMSLPWSFHVVRDGTFAIALLGAAFAAHHQRNLSMDLVSRRLPARGRLVLRIFLALFTVVVALLFLRAGLHVSGQETPDATRFIPTSLVAFMIPLGSALIIFHSLAQVVIDVDYLLRGVLPPERERTGH